MIHKINVFILAILIAFAPAYVFASLTDPTDQWIMESMTENKDSLGRTTTASLNARKVEIVNGSYREVSAAIDYKPPAGAAGRVMKKRLAQAAVGGGVALIGAALVDGLLKGIGWIMEDGVYVKVRQADPQAAPVGYMWILNGYGEVTPDKIGNYANTSPEAICRYRGSQQSLIFDRLITVSATHVQCQYIDFPSKFSVILKPYAPNTSGPERQKTPITNQELDDIMMGNYQGDPDANIGPKNDGVWTGVKETMTPDPNAGEGTKDKPSNEISKDIENKLDAAPNKTVKNTGTESKSNGENTKKNADGTEEKTQTETTQKMPAFCQYAAALCVWMDWTQQEPEPPTEPTQVNTSTRDVEDYGINPDQVFKTDRFQVSNQCPEPVTKSFELNGTHSFTLTLQPVCDVLTSIKPVLIGCGYLYAGYIVIGAARES